MLSVRILIIIVAMLHLDYAAAAVSQQKPAEKPAEFADIPGCYFVSQNKVLSFGDTFPVGQCLKYSCASNGAIGMTRCGVAAAGPGCRVVENPSLQYPDCCPTIKCGDS